MGDGIEKAIRSADGPAICAYVTGGYPDADRFVEVLEAVADAADVVEVGIPFTDPMADGQTIQNANERALGQGVTLESIIETVAGSSLSAPVALMGYLNPFLAFGFDRLASVLPSAGISGLIVPDLPLEESGGLRATLEPAGVGVIQFTSPTTPRARLGSLASASKGFLYAVTTTGVTGGAVSISSETRAYLDRVKMASEVPVLAGFGIRDRSQVREIGQHVDGVVVGSALLEAIDREDDPAAFLRSLRPETVAS